MRFEFVGGKAVIWHGAVLEPGQFVEVDDEEGETLLLRPDFKQPASEVEGEV